MKKIILMSLFIALLACNKESNTQKNQRKLLAPYYASLANQHFTSYGQELFNQAIVADRGFDILITHNQGSFVSFLVGGSLVPNSELTVNDQVYNPNLINNNYLYMGNVEPFYGIQTNIHYKEKKPNCR